MAFFKFRLPGAKARVDAANSAPTESVEAMRRRARHRLIGAAVLVLVAVVGFPLVFDTQPRPVAVDVPILIPDRNKVKPLVAPATAPQGVASVAGPVTPQGPVVTKPGQVTAQGSLDAKEEIVAEKSELKQAKPSVQQASSAINVDVKSEPVLPLKPEAKVEPKAAATKSADDGSRAKALLEGKSVASAAASEEGRFIVQIGAFADANKARETRLKVERAGLTTYTQAVETPDGKRIRVRVGPFASRAEADKAAAKIRGLDLPAAILTL